MLGKFIHKHVMAKVSSYEMPLPFSSSFQAVAVVQVTSNPFEEQYQRYCSMDSSFQVEHGNWTLFHVWPW